MSFHEFRGRADSGVSAEAEDLAENVLGAAVEVHRVIGPGLPESVYRNALSHELTLRGIAHVCEAPLPIYYKGRLVGEGRIDILVADCLIVELKSVEALSQVHRAQVIAYLQAKKLTLAFLINFNVAILKDGIKRVVNTY
jgi:GxxExxY protein